MGLGLGFRLRLGLGVGLKLSGSQVDEEKGSKRGGGVVLTLVEEAMSLALSSARASQKALWVMKLSFLQNKIKLKKKDYY